MIGVLSLPLQQQFMSASINLISTSFLTSGWQLKLRIVFPADEIIVEEVCIESSLDKTSDDRYPSTETLLREVAVDPVKNVECTIGPKKEDILSSQIVHISTSLQ